MPSEVSEVAVVEGRVDPVLHEVELAEVDDEATLVELGGGGDHLDLVVVAVQACALVIGRKSGQLMRGGEVKLLGDAKHQVFLRATASRQKSASS